MTRNTRPNEQQPRHRILHVTFNMGFGGTEQVIRQLVMHLPGEQFHNEILCIDGEVGEIGQRLATEQGITIHALKRQPGLDWRLAISIRRLIRERGITIIHCHQYTPWFYGWLGSLGAGVRRVFTEHGRFYPDRHRRKAWLVNKLMAATTDALVAISSATRDALVEYEFLPAAKIEVIYNGIEPLASDPEQARQLRAQLGIADDDLVLGTVSRLDPVKNQRMMLEAFSLFSASKAECWLLMVGDGPDRTMLEAFAGQLGIGERVIFTGFQSNPADYLNAMDIFLLSSHTEGTSMTVLEAMSLGKPCILTQVGGNPELVQDQVSGLLVPPQNPEAMATAMEKLANSQALSQRLGEQARAAFDRRFSARTMAENYIGCYHPSVRG
jgi:sugar transferase (PEP-CTERM/EpsH1 system associated)